MGRQRVPAALLLVALALCASPPPTAADHKVYINWLAHGNYTGWGESHGPFTQADWLVFYNPDQLLVAMVDEYGYNRCDSTHASFRYNRTQEIAIQLFDPQTYYFISDFDNCLAGMHLVIEAKQLPPPTPSGSGSARRHGSAAATVPRRLGRVRIGLGEREGEAGTRRDDPFRCFLGDRSEAIKGDIESFFFFFFFEHRCPHKGQ
ncbi:unnamed protein product [Alopecurus aequalis]